MVSVGRPLTAPPPPGRSWRHPFRGLSPAEGWSSIFLLAIVLLATAWTVARTDVAPDGLSMSLLAIGGLFTGLILAKASAPDLAAHVLAIVGGITASLLLAVERVPLAEGGRLERARALVDLSAGWLAQAQAGEPLDDPRLLAIMLGAAVWLVSYTSAWVLFRRGWLTTALALPVLIALANLGYAPDEGSLPLLVIVVVSTLLAARHAAYRRQIEWSQAQLPYPRTTASRFLIGGIVIALLVALLAWTAPLSTRDNILGQAWDRLSEPLSEVTDRWNELLARFGGPGDNTGGTYSAFGEKFTLGGHLKLSDDPVLVMQPGGPMRPIYLVGQRYDDYDGKGWQTTLGESFKEVAQDGVHYSPRLSFRSGQAVPLTPEVTRGRSQVKGVMSVIRPKGNLLFTLDTYHTSDRRTNAELPWQQYDNQTFSLAEADQASIPLDLQRIAVLVSRGSYTPASDGSSSADSPLPIDQALATDIAAERETLRNRFLDVHWQVGPDGRAEALIVNGQAPIYDDVSAVFSQDAVAAGDAYVVTGLTSFAGADQLRAAGTDYPSWVTDRYLELPPTITDRTRELAGQLAAASDNPFDTAIAVEDFVRKTIAYNEDIEPPPANQDVVDYVLFDSKQGYCEYYASAMAMLLRLEGIPSRVVGGYFPAPFDADAGGLLYREKNAHLWVEAFFPGYGWIPFEPTANRDPLSYGDITPGSEAVVEPSPVPTSVPTPEPTPVVATPPPAQEAPPQQPQLPTPADVLANPGRVAGLIGLVLVAVLAVSALAVTALWFAGFRGLSPVSGLYARALRAGNWLGVPPATSLTPREYAERVGRAVPSAQGPARVVADLYTRERYAASRPDADALNRARAAWRDLRGIAIGSLLRGKGR